MYAEPNDVRLRLGRSTTSLEDDVITAWLRDSLRYIKRGFQRNGLDLAAQVAANDPARQDLVDVQAEAVAERLRGFDPENLTSVTKSIDDGSITKRREGKAADKYDWLNHTQWDELLPIGKEPSGAFSTRPGFTPDTCWPWVH